MDRGVTARAGVGPDDFLMRSFFQSVRIGSWSSRWHMGNDSPTIGANAWGDTGTVSGGRCGGLPEPGDTTVWTMNAAEIILQVMLFALVAWSIWWGAQDAERRGKPGWLVGLLALLTWPVGLAFWLVARPSIKRSGPALFQETIDCPKCGVKISAGLAECPNCSLKSVDVA